jgi:hypothetical protein
VTVPKAPGAITQALSVDTGLERIREALALVVGDAVAASAVLTANVKLAAADKHAIRDAKRFAARAEAAQKTAAELSRFVVAQLRKRMSVRDVAHVLDLSPARVNQLEHSK